MPDDIFRQLESRSPVRVQRSASPPRRPSIHPSIPPPRTINSPTAAAAAAEAVKCTSDDELRGNKGQRETGGHRENTFVFPFLGVAVDFAAIAYIFPPRWRMLAAFE